MLGPQKGGWLIECSHPPREGSPRTAKWEDSPLEMSMDLTQQTQVRQQGEAQKVHVGGNVSTGTTDAWGKDMPRRLFFILPCDRGEWVSQLARAA